MHRCETPLATPRSLAGRFHFPFVLLPCTPRCQYQMGCGQSKEEKPAKEPAASTEAPKETAAPASATTMAFFDNVETAPVSVCSLALFSAPAPRALWLRAPWRPARLRHGGRRWRRPRGASVLEPAQLGELAGRRGRLVLQPVQNWQRAHACAPRRTRRRCLRPLLPPRPPCAAQRHLQAGGHVQRGHLREQGQPQCRRYVHPRLALLAHVWQQRGPTLPYLCPLPPLFWHGSPSATHAARLTAHLCRLPPCCACPSRSGCSVQGRGGQALGAARCQEGREDPP